ncbi:hypothetical protein [Arcicella rosea]|uniref:Uncharacterized protein n=1 Tax=Arcicella rosea TaxID=502909 RepID=A0A841EI50_9BACT|nr:hypothetical protein [Arcicella rosea]MBB6003877.1 hypothetical protein [Arcicella rosea]
MITIIKKILWLPIKLFGAILLSSMIIDVLKQYYQVNNFKYFKKGEVVRLNCLRFATDNTGIIIEFEESLMKISNVIIENNLQYVQFQDTDSDKFSSTICRKLYWYERFPVWKIKLKILYRSLFSEDKNCRIKYHDDDRVSRLLSRTEAKSLQQIYGGKVFIDFTNFKISDL